MLSTLSKDDYPLVTELFEPLAAFNLIVSAGLDGNNTCEILVDQTAKPTVALMHTVEGSHLVGTPSLSFVSPFRDYLQNIYFANEDELYLCISDAYLGYVDSLFAGYDYKIAQRQHYLCVDVAYDWQAAILEGYTVAQIDERILSNPHLEIPEHILNWIRYNWGSQANFYAEGFGFCVHNGQQIVSWSIADCKSGTACEIGIRTHDAYRRLGLAAITAAASSDYALSHGFTHVGWHCDAENMGSWKTAQKVGFVKERDYEQYCVRLAD